MTHQAALRCSPLSCAEVTISCAPTRQLRRGPKEWARNRHRQLAAYLRIRSQGRGQEPRNHESSFSVAFPVGSVSRSRAAEVSECAGDHQLSHRHGDDCRCVRSRALSALLRAVGAARRRPDRFDGETPRTCLRLSRYRLDRPRMNCASLLLPPGSRRHRPDLSPSVTYRTERRTRKIHPGDTSL
jgi:hypothetical protein